MSNLVERQVDDLRAELETANMRLVACMTVSMANTPESAAKARNMHPDYQCAAVSDVCRAVDREMQLRAALDAVLLERDALAMERRVSDSEMIALLKRVNREFNDRADEAEQAMRSLASYLGIGGYNAPTFDAATFERKIRDGIDMLTRPLEARAAELESQLVWLAEWCRKTLGVEPNKVIGSNGWPNRVAEVVARAAEARVKELEDQVETFRLMNRSGE